MAEPELPEPALSLLSQDAFFFPLSCLQSWGHFELLFFSATNPSTRHKISILFCYPLKKNQTEATVDSKTFSNSEGSEKRTPRAPKTAL